MKSEAHVPPALKGEGNVTLLTGATGFLGSEVARQLLRAGHRLRLAVRSPERLSGELAPSSWVEVAIGDLRDPEFCAQAVSGVGAVAHLAGLAHVFNSRAVPESEFRRVNAEVPERLAALAAAARVQRFVLASSIAVYGRSRSEASTEESPCAPEDAYGWSKHEGEARAQAAAELGGLPLAALRLSTLYGPGDPGNIARLMRLIARGRFVWIGDGRNRKSLIHRDDAARAVMACLLAPEPLNGIFNVSAAPVALREIVETAAAMLGRRIPPVHIPAGAALFAVHLTEWLGRRLGIRVPPVASAIHKWLRDDACNAARFEAAASFRAAINLRDGLAQEAEWLMRGIRRHTAPG